QLDDVRRDIDGLPSGIDSELRVLLRVEAHRLRTMLMKALMFSAEAPVQLDGIATRISLLCNKTDLAGKLYKLKEKLTPFLPPQGEKIKPILMTADQTEELLRAGHVTDENLASCSEKIEKALQDLTAETQPSASPSAAKPLDAAKVRADFKLRTPNMVVHPTFIDAYEVVTFTVEFADGEPPPSEIICRWNFG